MSLLGVRPRDVRDPHTEVVHTCYVDKAVAHFQVKGTGCGDEKRVEYMYLSSAIINTRPNPMGKM